MKSESLFIYALSTCNDIEIGWNWIIENVGRFSHPFYEFDNSFFPIFGEHSDGSLLKLNS